MRRLLAAGLAAGTDCHLPVRLWIHQDITASFSSLLHKADQYMASILNGLNDKLADGFDFGISMYSDRDKDSIYCYKDINGFGGEFSAKLTDTVSQALNTFNSGGGMTAEDAFSGIPFIVKNHFLAGTPLEQEARLLLIVTDDVGKYHNMQDDWSEFGFPTIPWSSSHGKKPDFDGDMDWVGYEDRMNCSPSLRFLEMNEITQPLKDARILPIVMTSKEDLNGANFYAETFYKAFFKKAGFADDEVMFVNFKDYNDLVQKVVDTVEEAQCKAPTNAPVTTSTTVTTTTSAAPTSTWTTTAVPSTASTATTPSSETTTAAPLKTTTGSDSPITGEADTTTTSGADSSKKRNVAPIAGAAAAGLTLLGALGALTYRHHSVPPQLEVDEMNATAENANIRNREAQAYVDESQFAA